MFKASFGGGGAAIVISRHCYPPPLLFTFISELLIAISVISHFLFSLFAAENRHFRH
jgi:hypothetical protein